MRVEEQDAGSGTEDPGGAPPKDLFFLVYLKNSLCEKDSGLIRDLDNGAGGSLE